MDGASEMPPAGPAAHRSGEGAGPPLRALRIDRRRAPMWLTVVLLALTCLGLLASTLTLWADAALLNTDQFVAVVAPLADDPRVIDGVSQYVADGVVAALDIPGRTSAVLPASGQFLVGPLQQTVQEFVQSRTAALLSSPQMRPIWQALARSLHTQVVAALHSQPSPVTISDGTLTIDLVPMIAVTLRQLQQADPSLVPSQLTIPDLSGMQSSQQERLALAQALGVQLPPDFGTVTLLHSDALTTAQRIVTALDTLRIVLPIVTLVLALAAIWSAANRRRALLLLGIGIAALFLAATLLLASLLGHIESSVTASPARVIVDVVVNLVRASLVSLLVGVAIAGALLAFTAYLTGPPQWLARWLPGAADTGTGGTGPARPAGPPVPAS